MRSVDATLYVIPGSHPSRTAAAMLDRKGIAYKRVDLMPVVSKGVLRAVGFPGITVPALKIDGRRSPGLARDRPGARPARPGAGALSVRSRSPDGRRAGGAVGRRVAAVGRPARPVERAAARSLTARLLLRGREAGDPDRPRRKDRGTDRGAVGPLQRRHRRERPRRPRRASGDAAANRRLDRRRRARRPRAQRGRSADRHQPAPADDLQDLRPAIASRPAGELAMRVDPDYPGDAPPILPPAWLAGLRAEQAAPAQ